MQEQVCNLLRTVYRLSAYSKTYFYSTTSATHLIINYAVQVTNLNLLSIN